MAALYAAMGQEGWGKHYAALKFGSSADVGYALLTGDVDAGFVEIDKLSALEKLAGLKRLTAIGRVVYPYGATLVLRKGLNLRINELAGLRIAVSSPECVLLGAFHKDAQRLGFDVSNLVYKTVPFQSMLPALESGDVDAAVIKGTYAVFALQQGHSILYQDWEVQPGDECCPAIIDQAALVLLVRKDKSAAGLELVNLLLKAQELDADALRKAIARESTIPAALLEGQPVAEFAPADDTLVGLLISHAHEEGESHADEDARNKEAK
jgi:ABC-type nitrate/sulfonate/bicarbonate transport system substrate-binding protein